MAAGTRFNFQVEVSNVKTNFLSHSRIQNLKFWAVFAGVAALSCGGGTPVGSGDNLSTLPTTPTGVEMAQAILNATLSADFLKTSETTESASVVSNYDATCPGGGSAQSI